jgi:predicted RecA/RadA family phage recombinase
MKNYIQSGNTVTVAAPLGGVASGALVVVGSLIGVAGSDAAAGADVEIETAGVFDLPKVVTDDVAAGNLLYYASATSNLTKTAGTGSKPLVGVAVKAAGNGVVTVRCKLGVHGIVGAA